MAAPLVTALVVGYLLGSLPFGYLVARAKGVNIFEVGSKNPGATNVSRSVGRWWGRLVLLLDAIKGVVAAGWPLWLARGRSGTEATGLTSIDFMSRMEIGGVCVFDHTMASNMAIAGLIGALIGHSFSCFTMFRGGKGVATGAGGFAVIFPYGALIALVVWLGIRFTTRYVSLASILAAVSLPITALFLDPKPVLVGVTAAVALFVLLRHRANISRLLAGTESKIGEKPVAPTS